MLSDAIFTTPRMDQVFSDENQVHCMLRFESALAIAMAKAELIDPAFAAAIKEVCASVIFDVQALKRETLLAGNPAIPFVKHLIKEVKSQNAEAANFVHFGATSQDVLDTATMLQVREAANLLSADLDALQENLAALALRHRDTVMIGRTLLQQARPITFGFKVAGWLDAVGRSAGRLYQWKSEQATLQFGGAVGTLSSLGGDALRVKALLADELQLNDPVISWHSHRGRFIEIASILGVLNGVLGKIGRDATLLMQTEIGEINEGAAAGKGGSSAMPHKRNPVSAVYMVAVAMRTPALVAIMFSAAPQENERAAGAWHAEWQTLAELVKLTAANLHCANDLIAHLEVNADRMLENLQATHGLIFAEDVATALSFQMGKAGAFAFVESACKAATLEKRPLKDYMLAKTDLKNRLSPDAIDAIFDAKNAIGISGVFTDQVLKNNRSLQRSVRVRINDAEIRYRMDGKEELPVLIFANSLGTNFDMWNDLVPYLTPYFRILRFNYRPANPDFSLNYSIGQLGSDVAALMAALQIEKAMFCGLSLGGLVGQWLGIHCPEKLEKLVLSNTAAKIGQSERWNERIDAVQKNGMGALWNGAVGRWFTPAFQSEVRKIDPIRVAFVSISAKDYAAGCDAVRDADFREDLAKIETPTLVVAGKFDPVTTVADGEFLRSRIKNARLAVIEASHLSCVERPQSFARMLIDYLIPV